MVVADETDVLVLLVHHFMSDIYMLSEMNRVPSVRRLIIPVRAVREAIRDTAAE